MSKVLEEFSELISTNKELVRMECRGYDDCGGLVLPKFDNSTISLFLLSQITSPNGFIEKYSLSEENAKRMKILRKMLNEDESLKEQIITLIEKKTSMSYSKFRKYELGYQQRLVNNVNIENEIPVLKKINIKN